MAGYRGSVSYRRTSRRNRFGSSAAAPGESEFELWIPSQAYELRVTSTSGVVAIDVKLDQTEFRLRRAVARQEHQTTNVH